MVINDLDRDGERNFAVPFKANAPLIVDPNTVLTRPVTTKRLETIARNHRQCVKGACRLDSGQFATGRSFETGKRGHELALGKALGSPIPISPDHTRTP